jgi:xylulokinase
MGAAMLAMVACGEYADVAAACEALVSVASVVTPDAELAQRYEARYQQYRKIYPALKQVFPLLQ